MQPLTNILLLGAISLTFSEEQFYPELRSDLQVFQDNSRCYPDVGEWYQMYRNFHSDPNYGGTAKCVKYSRYGEYQNFTTPGVITYGLTETGSVKGGVTLTTTPCYINRNLLLFEPYNRSRLHLNAAAVVKVRSSDLQLCEPILQKISYNETGGYINQNYTVIYTDCTLCYILRHLYVDNGFGCSLWRRSSTFQQRGDCCEFIYAENCGTVPKYQIYEPSCAPELGMPVF